MYKRQVQLRCRERFYERLAGLRMEAAVRVLADGKETACDRGEVQFTRNGISGIPVFQVSRHAVRALEDVYKRQTQCYENGTMQTTAEKYGVQAALLNAETAAEETAE